MAVRKLDIYHSRGKCECINADVRCKEGNKCAATEYLAIPTADITIVECQRCKGTGKGDPIPELTGENGEPIYFACDSCSGTGKEGRFPLTPELLGELEGKQ